MGLASDISQALGGQPVRRAGDYAALRQQVAFTPEETAAADANLNSADDQAEIQRELSRKDLPPEARRTLQGLRSPPAGGLAESISKALSGASEEPVAPAAPTRRGIPFVVEGAATPPAPEQQPIQGGRDMAVRNRMIPRLSQGTPERSINDLAPAVGDFAYYGLTKAGLPDDTSAALSGVAQTAAGLINPIPGGGAAAAAPKGVRAIGTLLRAEAPKMAEVAGGSVGARGLNNVEAARAAVQSSSPELQQAVEKTVKGLKSGDAVHMEALQRHVDADSLPKPMHLSKGQATQDVALLSEEQNKRGMNQGQYAKLFDQQNKDLIENAALIREQAAPDVFTVNKAQHADTIVNAYEAKDAALRADISAKYKALEDANGGQFPLDGKAFAQQAEKALQDKLKSNHLPASFAADLREFKEGVPMTFEKFEAMRSNLAGLARSGADGNAKAAGAVVRDALESMPMPKGAEHLKPLADEARAAAKARFDLIKGDPAYKAVVTEKVRDNFIDRFVVNADRKSVATMLNNLAHDEAAQQTARAGAIDTLREAAGIRGEGASNFSQAGFNKALEKLGPKMEILFEPTTRNQLQALGNTAKVTQLQPRGSFVNNSNTLTGALAEAAKSGAEGAANVAAGGIPIGKWVRQGAQVVSEKRALNETMKPGAGILLKKAK